MTLRLAGIPPLQLSAFTSEEPVITKCFCARVSIVAAGLLVAPVVANPRPSASHHSRQDDARLEKLRSFFRDWDSPGERYAEVFLAAADNYDLDWRLLPSICLVESGCGKVYRNNNMLGWDNCDTSFPTPEGGIWLVASRLARSPLYVGKPLDGVLFTYNPRQRYARAVRRLMLSLAPETEGPVRALD